VPMTVISPWSKGGWVNSELFDHTSLIKFIEQCFGSRYAGLRKKQSTAWPRAVTGDRTSEALGTISEAEAVVERREERWWSAELHRLRGMFLAATGADAARIEASFCAAIRTAREQKSVSLEKRAEATYAEYRRQK